MVTDPEGIYISFPFGLWKMELWHSMFREEKFGQELTKFPVRQTIGIPFRIMPGFRVKKDR